MMAYRKSGDLEDDCPDNTCAEDGAVDDMYTSQSLGTAATILFTAGGVLSVTGIVLLIAGKKRYVESARTIQTAPISFGTSFNGIQLKGCGGRLTVPQR